MFTGALGIGMLGFVMAIEMGGKKTKTAASNWSHIPFPIGCVFVSFLAMGVRDWRTFQVRIVFLFSNGIVRPP